MRSKLMLVLLIVTSIVTLQPVNALTPSPKITWDCQLMRLSDDRGAFVYFDPRAQVIWYGKKLKYQALYWTSQDTRLSQAGQRYGTVTAGRGGKNVSSLDLREKFYYGNENEYKKIQLTVTDSAGKKSKQSCTWDGPVANGW